MRQTQIQMIKYVLNDTKRIKRNKLHWYFTHLHPLIWIFKQFWCAKWFWQKFCHKKPIHLDHSYLKYALIRFSNKTFNVFKERPGPFFTAVITPWDFVTANRQNFLTCISFEFDHFTKGSRKFQFLLQVLWKYCNKILN